MIYLDNCATTIMREEVKQELINSINLDFANPSSLHSLGHLSEKKIAKARNNIAKALKISDKELFFTSGGTESNNMAIQSIVRKMQNRGKHIITTNIEHPSVYRVMKKLEEEGFDVTYLEVDEKGFISMDELSKSLRDDTILVSIIHVNNEIGSIQDIKGIKKILDDRKSIAMFHLDGVQSFGKIDFSLYDLGVDTYSFSGHKIHGPKGIGGIYIKDSANIEAFIYGGNQERGLRSGTENIQGIMGLSKAVEIQFENLSKEYSYVKDIKEYFIKSVKDQIDDVKINSGKDDKSSPYIVNLSFLNTKGEVLLHYLENKDIYVSTASACSANGTEKSHVLKNIGLNDKEIAGAIRVCFSYMITKEDIDTVVKELKDSVKEIREIIMR